MDNNSIQESSDDRTSFDPNPVNPVAVESVPTLKGYAWLAWIVIAITVGVIMLPGFLQSHEPAGESSTVMLELPARYLVGAASLAGKDSMDEGQIHSIFGKGPLRQRLMESVLLAELSSPEKGLNSLRQIETEMDAGKLIASDTDRTLFHYLQQIQTATKEHQPLDEALQAEWPTAQSLLPEQLGWVGKLAVLPAGSPDHEGRSKLLAQGRRTLFVILGVFVAAMIAITCGAVLQILWWGFAILGRLNSGIEALRGNSGIYAETFAVWLALYLAIGVLMRFLPLPRLGMIWIIVPQIVSLAALAWPVVRGVGWQDVRKDIGLNFGTDAWSTPFLGIGAYLAALPALLVAMLFTLLMMFVASQLSGAGDDVSPPVHPIVEPLFRGSWTVKWQLVFIAVFAAVPEEIMFRGVLYRHLRESGKSLGYVGSVAFGAIISSLVFAAIHPQGLFGIPILMTLATVFALTREWRGSLVPSIIAHALVNAGTSGVLLLIAD